MNQEKVKKNIDSDLDFILKHQLPNGNFTTFSWDKKQKKSPLEYQTTFLASFVLHCLADIKNIPKAKKIAAKTNAFLLSQKSPFWSFNYWDRTSDQCKNSPYPDDLDDTFCALASMHKFNPKIGVDGQILANVVNLLTVCEAKEGGPYRTWIVKEDAPDAWKDVDVAVNSNIGFFLAANEIELPSINELIKNSLAANTVSSPYYPNQFPILFFISRFISDKALKKDCLDFARKTSGQAQNILDKLFLTLAMINLSEKKEVCLKLAEEIFSADKSEMNQNYCFYLDKGEKKGELFYSGAATLNYALRIHLAVKYLALKEVPAGNVESFNQKLFDEVVSRAELIVDRINPDMKESLETIKQRITQNDPIRQAVLLPALFHESLANKFKNKISKDNIHDLCLATFWGWVAYRIYDDIMDQGENRNLLPLATIAQREMEEIFFSGDPNFKVHASEILNLMDSANFWESKHCLVENIGNSIVFPSKLPEEKDASKFGEKSLGHILGPMKILWELGIKAENKETNLLKRFFIHFLSGKQMNDDAHDWEQDLSEGKMNSSSLEIIRAWQRTTKKHIVEKDSGIKEFQMIFWNKTIIKISKKIIANIDLAEKALADMKIVKNKLLLGSLLDPVRKSAQKALEEQRQAKRFIKQYEKDGSI